MPAGRRWTQGRIWGLAAAIAAVVLLTLPSTGSATYDARLKRYPYLTDLVGTSVMVNFATDISLTTATVKYGLNGSTCDTNMATASRTFMVVNGVSEYQWKAQLTGLAPDTDYCYRVYFGNAQIDLLGTDASPVFRSQVPAGSSTPFKFAVFGNWGKTLAAGNVHQTNVITQIAQSGARFAVTGGDNAYEAGSERSYGDLYQTGDNTSGVFGPSFWKIAGASVPIFPAIGNHDHNNSILLKNFPQDAAVATSAGTYETRSYCCTNGTNPDDYPTGWYAFDAGLARFYVLETAWENNNVGTADLFKNDFDNHWGPSSPQYQWLKNDLETHPRALRFAFHHFPLYSDQSPGSSDTWLQGANSLEGLLKVHDVTIDFNAHSHNYQRNSAPAGGVPSYVSGGGGANLESIGSSGCSSLDLYGLGWSNVNNTPSACGAAPLPTGKEKVHHFLLVSVSGTSVTVTPTNSLGETFDVQSYNAPAENANLAVTKTDTPDPVLVGQQLTYNLTVSNSGPRAATGTLLTDTLPANVTFESATPSQGTCSQTGVTVSCQLGTIANSGNATVQVKVRPQATGSITNSATVASNLNDPTPANNTATASTTVNPAADLAVTKTDSPDPVAVGQELTYTVGVSNAGPSTATGVTLTDTLPSGVTFNSATTTQGSCSQASGTVTCSLGNLVDTAGATVTIKVTPQNVATITNSASVTSLTGDPNGANNTSSAQTTVGASANLALTKSDAPDPVLVGELLTYSLTVSNAGPSGATGTTITDTLPSGVTFDSATASQGTCSESSGTVTCALGTIGNGANATASIKVRPQAQGSITNTASVSSSALDPNLTNNSASAGTTVNPVADLAVSKTDSPDPALVGQPLTYTVGVQNNGPSTATSVSLGDTLPAGVTFNSATPSQGSCSHSAGTVTCPLGTIANGAGASVQITVTPQATGSITNTATASSSVTDTNSANNTASATTTVDPAADLSLTKSDSPDPVRQGQQLVYTLGVANAGPSSAGAVVLSDTLPSGVTFNSATASQGSCGQTAGVVTCSLGTIASGGSASAQITVTPPDTGSISNTASVSSTTSDPNQVNNSAAATTTVDPVADLSITKTDAPDPVASGQELTYSLNIGNAGPSSAAGVTVTDSLPGGVTFTSATPSQGSCSQASGTVTCALGTVASGGNASVSIKVVPGSGGSITNQASVSSTTFDPALVNNAASATTTVDPVADLTLTKTDSPDPVLSAQQVTYTLTVHNDGPASAPSTSLSDSLPGGVSFVSATTTQGSCVRVGSTVTCALGTIASGANVTIEIKVDAGAPGTITNEAAVVSTASDPNTANNAASATTTVKPVADLGLTKSDSPDPVLAGQLLTYTLGVTNAGPHTAPGATVTDTLPSGVTFESATPSQGTCSESSGTVTCALGSVAGGATPSVEIKVRPQSEGSVTNSAAISSDAGDLNSSNNSASTTTAVDPAADLELTKTDSPDPAGVGQQITYTLGVHNAGPSATAGVALSDTLPAGVTFDSATTTQGSCLPSGGSVLCTLGTLASQANATVTIKVTPQAPGSITNTASVVGATVDPDTADNSASATTTVNPAADLALTKSDSPDPVPAGDVLTYTLDVQNAGPQDASGTTVTDTLPAGVVYESATPSQGTCSEASGTVTCALGTVANGAGASVVIEVRPQEGGQITNQAGVSSSGSSDLNQANNSATATTDVTPVADLALSKSDSPDPVLAGEVLTYLLTVDNSGPSTAASVELIDTLPAGVTYESATPTQGTCAEDAGTVTCALGTVASGQQASVLIDVRPGSPGTIANEAGVASAANDPNSADNSATEETTVTAAADLSLTKGDSPDPVLEGQALTYDLSVQNAGPQDATGTTVTDTLPAGVTFESATPTQGTCSQDAGTVTCALGTIASGAGADVEIQVTPSGPGTITNEASVTSDLADPDSADTTASAETTVRPVADLALTKSDSPDPVQAGELLTYTLGVTNAGPRDATTTVLTDTLPAGVTFDSATPSQGTCSQDAGTVTCALGTIANGAGASVEIKVVPQADGTITNQASIGSAEGDSNPADNDATAETTVDPAADLSLTKSDSPDPVLAGAELTYTLSVQNAGPSTAPAVTVTDTLPAGVTYESATPTQGTCSESGGTVTCDLGSLADEAGASVEIKVRPSAPGTISNQAGVVSLVTDPDTADNSASEDTTVDAAADLSLTKSDSPDPVFVGDLLTYLLDVQSSGPQDATGVTLTDTLPAGVTFESATPTQGTCSESGGTVTCELGTVTSGAGASVVVEVRPQAAGTITNQAGVTSDLPDPDSADATASEDTTVEDVADLAVSQSDSPDPVLAGEEVAYAVTVQNSGPQSATGVTLTDTLPAADYVSATPTQGTCAEDAGTVTCELGTLADEASAAVEIRVRPSTPGVITNLAAVASDAHDPQAVNDSSSEDTTVDPAADLSLTKTDSPDPVFVGELVTYLLTIQNSGPQSATGVTATDTLPAGVTYHSATPSQGTCSESGGTVTCALGTLADEATATVAINARPASTGSITNQASVTATESDPTANNSASTQTTVNATPVAYARPKSASPLRTSLVPAYSECTAPNREHGPPLGSPSCNPPAQQSSFLTVGSPDANSRGANMSGAVRFTAVLGNVGTPADEADVGISVTVTDVRNRTTLDDYTGELQGRVVLRITDRRNGDTGIDTATMTDTPYTFTVPCSATGGAGNIGATCSLNTTADAITPGTVTETKRTIWQTEDVVLYDGGSDGDAETAGNTSFLRQGVFIP